MTITEAKQLGAISTKQFKTGKREATFNSVRASANFRYELEQKQIAYTDRFAKGGLALTYRWKEQSNVNYYSTN